MLSIVWSFGFPFRENQMPLKEFDFPTGIPESIWFSIFLIFRDPGLNNSEVSWYEEEAETFTFVFPPQSSCVHFQILWKLITFWIKWISESISGSGNVRVVVEEFPGPPRGNNFKSDFCCSFKIIFYSFQPASFIRAKGIWSNKGLSLLKFK